MLQNGEKKVYKQLVVIREGPINQLQSPEVSIINLIKGSTGKNGTYGW